MSARKILTKRQRELVRDYLTDQGKALGSDDWESFIKSRSHAEKMIVYKNAKQWARDNQKPKTASNRSQLGSDPHRLEEKTAPVQEEAVAPAARSSKQSSPRPSASPKAKNGKTPFLAHLTQEQLQQLKDLADRTGESRAHHVRRALNEYLEKQRK